MRRVGWVIFAVLLCTVPVVAWLRVAQRPVEKPLRHLGTMPALNLTTQEGKPFDAERLRGKVRIVDFIFTRCAQICPRLTDELRRVQETLRTHALPVEIVSISVDPDNDTPAALKDFAAKHHADLSNWTFLTGPAATIDDIVMRGFKQGIDRALGDGGVNVTHGSRLVLVDAEGGLRGLYDTTDATAMTLLVKDIDRLVHP